MKKVLSLLIAIAMIATSSFSYALPHNNRSDVQSTVKMFIPWNEFHTVNDLSLGAGTPSAAEIGTLGVGAIKVAAAGDDIHTLLPLPNNICVKCPIKLSVLWSTTSSTTSQTATWKVLYNETATGSLLDTAATALDTPITADSVEDVALDLNETAQGVISANTLDRGDILHILVEIDAVSGLNLTTSATYFHGMYLEYSSEKL